MSFIDPDKREINFKIVYYGPSLAGKLTNMQLVHDRYCGTAARLMSAMRRGAARYSFDFLWSGGVGAGEGECRVRLETVPGPVFHDPARRIALEGADGVVFVADSQEARMEANVEDVAELDVNLAANGFDMATFPIVLQYNKRDLPTAVAVSEMDRRLGLPDRERFEAVATKGIGVLETFDAIGRQVIKRAERDA